MQPSAILTSGRSSSLVPCAWLRGALAALLLATPGASQEAVVAPLDRPQVDVGHAPEDRVLASIDLQAPAAPWPQALSVQELAAQPYGDGVLSVWKTALQVAVQTPSEEESPEARAQRSNARLQLCLIAKAHDRHQDAWRHFRALLASPTHASRALPYLWPGVPFDTEWSTPTTLALPAQATLSPAFPPQPELDEPMLPGPQRMHCKGALTVGGNPLDLRATLQSTGYELDLVQGSPANPELAVTVVLPKPRNFRRDLVYSDWVREDDTDQPVTVALPAGREDAWTLFERLKPDFEAWPAHPSRTSPWRKQRRVELELTAPLGDQNAWQPTALAQHLSALLELPVEVVASPDPVPARTTRVRLDPGAAGLDRVRRLLSSVEAFLLASE